VLIPVLSSVPVQFRLRIYHVLRHYVLANAIYNINCQYAYYNLHT
jgi:hypothetical protein